MSFTTLESQSNIINPSDGWSEIVDGRLALTQDGKIEITNRYAVGQTISQIRHSLFLPTYIIEMAIRKNVQIESDCRILMNQQKIISTDSETGEVAYNDKPNTLQELKDLCYVYHPECNRLAFDNVIDKIIEGSKSDGSGDWEFYSTNIIGG